MQYVDYIQSMGDEYINTGVVPNENTSVEMKYSVQEIKNIGPHILSNSAWYFPLPRTYSGTPHFFISKMGGQSQIPITPEVDVDYTIKVNSDGQVVINGLKCAKVENGTSNSTAPLYMFTYGGAPTNSGYLAKAKIYYCKIWDGDELIRDFKPAINDYGNPGMYDAVNQTFYAGDWSGGFTYGIDESDIYTIHGSTMESIAQAIRAKVGSEDRINPLDMPDMITGIQGSDSLEKELIEGDLSEYSNNSVTSIRDYAFYSHTSLTSVDFSACTSIGNYAFQYCSSLTSVNFPVCTSIGYSAFAYCYSLTSISFPKCDFIGQYAFTNCSSLASIDFPECTYTQGGCFYNCGAITTVNFPRCQTLGRGTFSNCISLTSMDLPVCVSISSSAFYSCKSLTNINAPICSNIETAAFYLCSSLTSVDFPVCTSIGNSAFQACYSLESVNLPKCTIIGSSAFQNCSSLTSVDFPACTRVNGSAFNGCKSLTTVNVSACTSIGVSAFMSCYSLKTIDFSKCAYIGAYAFYHCSSLTTVSCIGGTVLSRAFLSCKALSSVVFTSATHISSQAFVNCSKLMYLELGGASVPTLYNAAVFNNTPLSNSTYTGSFGSIYVPASLVDAYKTANYWSQYSNRITAIVE